MTVLSSASHHPHPADPAVSLATTKYPSESEMPRPRQSLPVSACSASPAIIRDEERIRNHSIPTATGTASSSARFISLTGLSANPLTSSSSTARQSGLMVFFGLIINIFQHFHLPQSFITILSYHLLAIPGTQAGGVPDCQIGNMKLDTPFAGFGVT